MIYTSYFENIKNVKAADPDAVFIAVSGGVPDWYSGERLKCAAPKWSWWKWWHDTYAGHYDSEESVAYYTACYRETVLQRLDRDSILSRIACLASGHNAYLLCFETPEKFCHRHLLADWLNQSSGQHIIEWQKT